MLEVTATTLENDDYRLVIDPADGSVTSLVHKSGGGEMIDTATTYRFNELATNTHEDAVQQNPPVAGPPSSASASVETDGPLLAAIRVTRTGTPHVETIYRLYRGEDRVEIENALDRDLMAYVPNDMHTRSHVVTMPFDIHDLEIRSETTTRFLDPVGDSFVRDSVFDYHNVEHTLAFWDGNRGVHYAVDNSLCHHFENLSILGSAAYSRGDALLLTRLKDKQDEYEFKGGQIGTYEKEPDTSPIYRHRHHLRATAPGFDPVAASRFGFEALSPLLPRLLARGPGNLPDAAASFFRVDAANVLLYTVKPADNGDGLVLRLSELTGQPTTAVVSSDVLLLSDPERVEQDEDGGEPLGQSGGDVVVPLEPYETATVRVQVSVSWAPIELSVGKNGSGILLSWTGGVTPYTLQRSEDPSFTATVDTLVDEEDESSHLDPVLGDGRTYFYLVR
jgi:hypothetical protein